MLHAKGMSTVVVYDIYLEVCKCKLDESWTNADPISYHKICEQILTQILAYDPRKRLYAGDELMRISTKQHMKIQHGKHIRDKAA